MTTGQHPAQTAEPDQPHSLTLVLPAGLGHDQALTGLIQAITRARSAIGDRTRQFQQLAAGYAARNDQTSHALCRGQAMGSDHAAATIDEAIIEIFDLWPQYDTQLQQQAEDPQPAPGRPCAALPPAQAGDR
jgi:hypothetical protein